MSGKTPTPIKSALTLISQNLARFYRILPLEIIVFVALTLLSAIFLVRFVELAPTVDNNFFFSSEDPQFQSENLINRLFVRKDSQLIISAKGNISEVSYREKISQLSHMILEVEGVASVISLTHAGPGTVHNAINSPLWKRLIVSSDRRSTNLIVFLDENKTSAIIPQIEKISAAFESEEFHLRSAGLPYVVELIKRNLLRDLRVFSLLACLIFGLLIFMTFHSKSILCGTLITCLNACMWTLMTAQLVNIPMGLLTANLGTIIFVMTLSHIIFLIFNWRALKIDPKCHDPVNEAIKRTFSPSFWSMLTTFLGFMSLLSVSAKPLRDLGVSGAIGSVIALCAAYSVFPAFLRIIGNQKRKSGQLEHLEKKTYRFIDLERQFVMLTIFVTCLLTLPGLAMLETDPSLLSYFSQSSEIYKGLSYIDQNGGSSPLLLVVRSKDNEKIHSDKNYNRLWKLQDSLEQHHAVGSVISLPVLIAQAQDTPFLGWIIPREFLLSAMEKPINDAIAKSFVTKDRKYGLFLLRMIESYRTLPRLEIIEEIKTIVENEGFFLEIEGGIYSLQGHLAKLVAASLLGGLGQLILLFGLIAWIISRSLRVTLSVMASIFIIPLTVLGCFGIYRIPLDIIAAPASNVAIAMGIDSMIHMIKAFRRTQDWQVVRNELWQPILTSMYIVATGFAIFLSSTFPPTKRFGGAIVLGTILSALTALYIMPLLYNRIRLDEWIIFLRKKKK